MRISIRHRGEFAGAVWYHEIDRENRSAEFGYWLGAAFEGKGLVTKVCRVMIAHAFGELNLNRIVIICDTENPKSLLFRFSFPPAKKHFAFWEKVFR